MAMSTLTIAAPYAAQHQKLRDIVAESKKLPDGQIGQRLGILNKQLVDEHAREPISDEVKDLGIRAATLDATFASVNVLLAQHQDTTPSQGLEQWGDLRQTYHGLVTQSAQVAGQAFIVADEFVHKFLASFNNQSTMTEKLTAIREYQEMLKQDGQKVQGLMLGLTQLRQSVKEFLSAWPSQDGEADARAQQLNNDIHQWRDTIADLLTQISNIQLTLTYGAIPQDTGITSILGAIIPTFWTGALTGAIEPILDEGVLAGVKSERDALRPEIAAKTKERDQIVATLPPAQQIHALLVQILTELDGIIKPLSAIAATWNAIPSDLEVVAQTMQQGATAELLFKRLTVFGGLYALASGIFAGYQHTVEAVLAAAE